jgi:peptidoglycan DL-endopeptidase CwlO
MTVITGGRRSHSLGGTIVMGLTVLLLIYAFGGFHSSFGTSTGSAAGSAAALSGPVTATRAEAAAISYAEQQIGKPYVYGATGPDSYDCSGLVMTAWAHAGVSIPRTSEDQWNGLPHINASQLKPGDLILYHGALEPGENPPGHVAMYIGNGQMVEAYDEAVGIRKTAVRPDAWGYVRVGP